MQQRYFRWVPILLPVLIEIACSSGPEPNPMEFGTVEVLPTGERPPARLSADSGAFPRPAELEPQVAFWRDVYSRWKRSQAVVHDDRYLSLVYEVVDLPGEVAESYTAGQKAYLRERREYWRNRLRDLELALSVGQALRAEDEQLLASFTIHADQSAVHGASERVRVQRGLRERFKRGIEISGRYDRVFRKIFRRAGLPEDLAYLPHVESSFQAEARSSAGAVGIWQFTRSAAKLFMDLDAVGDRRMDPIASAHGAARYLASAHGKLGSWPLALTSYNHGIGGMQRARQHIGDDFVRIVREYDHPKFGFASRNFYAEFLAAREIAAQPERFFPEGIQYDEPIYAEGSPENQAAAMSSYAESP